MNSSYMRGLKLLMQWVFNNSGPASLPATESANTRTSVAPAPKTRDISTCIPCSIDHTATVCGILNESLRFARRQGIANFEVQKRIAKAEEELNAMERFDLDAQEIAKLPQRQRGLMGWLTTKSKDLRDRLKKINELEDLETITADACRVRLEFRTKSLGLPGPEKK